MNNPNTPAVSKKNLDVSSMIPRMLEIYKSGGFICHICAEFYITEKQYHYLRDQNTDFAEAIEIGKMLCEMWWMNKAMDYLVTDSKTTFNATLWYMIMRNKFNYGDRPGDRRRKINNYGGSLADKMIRIDEMIRDGEITTLEHKNFIDALHKEAQIFEIYKLQPRVEKLLLDVQLKNNEISQLEYDIKVAEIEARVQIFDNVRAISQSPKAKKNRKASADKKAALEKGKKVSTKEKRNITIERILSED